MAERGLLQRLENGGSIVIAEGYMREFERRGYLKLGPNVPEVVLQHPHLVKMLTEEFAHAGSDVCEAFMYYTHREKLKFIGREDDLERMNRRALKIAREVATATGTLMAGGLCNTGVYEAGNEETYSAVNEMFKEQVQWAVEEGADYMIGETFNDYGEAKLALEAIQKYGNGLPAVITMACYVPDETTDGIPFPKACQMLEEAGAAVVGVNCGRGPRTMLPLIREIRKACKGPVAALPVPFRTGNNCKTFQSLKDRETGKSAYPTNLECMLCSRDDVKDFAIKAKEIGINYIGLCCGNSAAFIRELAEVYGRKPEASKYSPDMSLSFIFGDAEKTSKYNKRVRDYMLGNITK